MEDKLMDEKTWKEVTTAIMSADVDTAVEGCTRLHTEAGPEDVPRLLEMLEHPDFFVREPVTALWNYPAVLYSGGTDVAMRPVALQTLYSIRRRLELLVALPMHGIDSTALRDDVRDMAHMNHFLNKDEP
jgi:hypothetical protein